MAGFLHLPDGTCWPRPALETDEDEGAEWRARYAPDTLTRADLLWLASVAHAYGSLVARPAIARKLPAIRRALRAEAGS